MSIQGEGVLQVGGKEPGIHIGKRLAGSFPLKVKVGTLLAVMKPSIQADFEKFHDDNPHIYTELVFLARKMKRTGKTYYGISCLWEVLRWNADLQSETDNPYKLNNNYRSRYARLISEQEPDLKDFFRMRDLRAQ